MRLTLDLRKHIGRKWMNEQRYSTQMVTNREQQCLYLCQIKHRFGLRYNLNGVRKAVMGILGQFFKLILRTKCILKTATTKEVLSLSLSLLLSFRCVSEKQKRVGFILRSTELKWEILLVMWSWINYKIFLNLLSYEKWENRIYLSGLL